VFADPVLGNVIQHVTAETDAGKIVYIGTRLKVVDGKIKEVEINYDDRPEVNAKNLIPYDPLFNTIVPEGKRSTRAQLERIITSYFQGLTDHKPIEADYDPRCDRYHSGNRVTHNARNGVENSGTVDTAHALADFILFEQQCCSSITYELRSEPRHSHFTLQLRAPADQVVELQKIYSREDKPQRRLGSSTAEHRLVRASRGLNRLKANHRTNDSREELTRLHQ
jgi:hypothetical protein